MNQPQKSISRLPGDHHTTYPTRLPLSEPHNLHIKLPNMSKPFSNSSEEPPTSRTRRLQNKIKRLEEQIRQAEITASESSLQAGTWANEILLGRCPIKQAPLEMTIRCHRSSLAGSLASDVQGLPESGTPRYPAVSRRFVHDELGRWDPRQDLPAPLRHLLCVPLD